jgi:DNA-binding transcriptional LysR family regulator
MHFSQIVDLRDCERLVALAEDGSFAAAARGAGVRVPRIRQQMEAMMRNAGTQ